MYECGDCGAEFEDPVLDELDGDAVKVCPDCGSEDIGEAGDRDPTDTDLDNMLSEAGYGDSDEYPDDDPYPEGR